MNKYGIIAAMKEEMQEIKNNARNRRNKNKRINIF